MLFCREKNVERETWEGFRFGPDGARTAFGFDAAFAVSEIDTQLPRLSPINRRCFTRSARRRNSTSRCAAGSTRCARKAAAASPRRRRARSAALLDDMRLVKDDHDLAIMRRAAQISAAAHRRAMAACHPGVRDINSKPSCSTRSAIPARRPRLIRHRGGGPECLRLHYPAGNAIAQDGDLILIDAACELDG